MSKAMVNSKETKKNDQTILRDFMYGGYRIHGTKSLTKISPENILVLCDVRIFYDFMKKKKKTNCIWLTGVLSKISFLFFLMRAVNESKFIAFALVILRKMLWWTFSTFMFIHLSECQEICNKKQFPVSVDERLFRDVLTYWERKTITFLFYYDV